MAFFEAKPLTPEETEERRKRDELRRQESEEYEKRDIQRKRWDAWHRVIRHAGDRYSTTSFDNYEVSHPEQAAVVDDLKEYSKAVGDNVTASRGVVLFGPSGTGKDHLLLAMARIAIGVDILSVHWACGQELFGGARDLIGGNGTERDFVKQYTRPTILILSDPLPVSGALTDFQAGLISRIVDGRYRNGLPTWCSMNVKTRGEVEERMGVAIADRLRHDAVTRYCSWPSYRTALTKET